MATILRRRRLLRDSIASGVLGAWFAATASAAVGLVGTLPGKAILAVDGTTRTVAVGQKFGIDGRLIAVEGNQAVIESGGQRQTLRVGQNASGTRVTDSAVLAANAEGHYLVMGQINGVPLRMIVDTGATLISLGAADAKRLGLNLANAERGQVQTAAGVSSAHRVRLDSVQVGGITMQGVDALVLPNDLPVALLGMSFLGRTDMQREGDTLTLKKRY
jgi:aspartyl protease family protein